MNQSKVRLITCDKCNNAYFLSSVKIEERRIKLSQKYVNVRFFRCPNKDCDHIDIVSIIDDKTESINAELNTQNEKIRRALEKGIGMNQYQAMQNKVMSIKGRMSANIDNNLEKYRAVVLEDLQSDTVRKQ